MCPVIAKLAAVSEHIDPKDSDAQSEWLPNKNGSLKWP